MACANGIFRASGRAAARIAPAGAGAVLAFLLVSMLGLPARGGERVGDELPPSQPLAEGRAVFEQKGCAHCHSVFGGEGTPGMGPDLGRNGFWQDIMRFAASLWNHTPAMTESMRAQRIERSTLSPEEMGKLAAYLFYVRFFDEPGDVHKGRELFERRLCARCHQFGGRGGTVGPRLDELKDYMSSFFMAQALWNHGPEMAAKLAELRLARPRLEGDDVAHLVAFIRGNPRPSRSLELAQAEVGSPRAGKALFAERGCVKCHAIGGTGGTAGPDLGAQRQRFHVTEVAGALWNHGAPMWAKMRELGMPFPRLTSHEMADLLAYLYFVQYMGEPGEAAKGREVFSRKSCAQCHAVRGEGPGVGPDLAASTIVRSPLHWASAMWNHAPAMEKKVRETNLPWPRFEDDEMRDLVTFLRSRAGGK